VGKKAGCCIDI